MTSVIAAIKYKNSYRKQKFDRCSTISGIFQTFHIKANLWYFFSTFGSHLHKIRIVRYVEFCILV